ncbi:MBL fold metallo-hydrolase [Gemmatimonadota bacterium]
MKALLVCTLLILFVVPAMANGQESFGSDTFATTGPLLEITFIGHGTLMFTWGDLIIHIDPVSSQADYSGLPKADLILITHEHGDHLDTAAIETISQSDTQIIYTALCAEKLEGHTVLVNGTERTILGVTIEAVPAYNIVNTRPNNGQPFHPPGIGNGYVLTFGDMRVYVAGDSENTPEMKALKDIDIAFLPMNLPYTMTPGMAADAARAFRPRILYPYHFGETDTEELVRLLLGEDGIEVRIRDLK